MWETSISGNELLAILNPGHPFPFSLFRSYVIGLMYGFRVTHIYCMGPVPLPIPIVWVMGLGNIISLRLM